MILIDTHIWIWWVQDEPQLTSSQRTHLLQNQSGGLGVSVFSCLEVARLDSRKQITLPLVIDDWIRAGLNYPGIKLVDFTPEIAIESIRIPSPFHKDPADRILIATARALNIPLLTADAKILNYPHVQTLT